MLSRYNDGRQYETDWQEKEQWGKKVLNRAEEEREEGWGKALNRAQRLELLDEQKGKLG